MMRRAALLCLLLAASGAGLATAQDAAPPSAEPAAIPKTRDEQLAAREKIRHAMLISHGINPREADLVAFLTDGFAPEAISRKLPDEPAHKAEVLGVAIEEIGRQELRAAAPVLVQLVEGKPTPGVQAILMLDSEQLPLEQADFQRSQSTKVLQVNAIVALGMIGEPSAADAILMAMRRAVERGFITEGAIALGLMDRPDGLGPLVLASRDPEAPDLDGMFAAVYYLTGRNYGLSEHTSLARRRQACEELRVWFETDGGAFMPVRADIQRRRARGMATLDPPLESLRGALRATRNLSNYDARWAGRERLRTMGPGAAGELKAIATDEFEDLDIRRAAMQWYAAADPKAAKGVMEDLEDDDENPVIRAQAKSLLPEIEKYRKASGK